MESLRQIVGIHGAELARAQRRHKQLNPHHWEYWCTYEHESSFLRQMPERYALEMIADWMGARRATHGNWDIHTWYKENYYTIRLHGKTRRFVNDTLMEIDNSFKFLPKLVQESR